MKAYAASRMIRFIENDDDFTNFFRIRLVFEGLWPLQISTQVKTQNLSPWLTFSTFIFVWLARIWYPTTIWRFFFLSQKFRTKIHEIQVKGCVKFEAQVKLWLSGKSRWEKRNVLRMRLPKSKTLGNFLQHIQKSKIFDDVFWRNRNLKFFPYKTSCDWRAKI